MKLYKNVGIEDLEKILKEGILPISKTGNDNWSNSGRAHNSTDVVYLFNPLTDENSFYQYGSALLEVEVEGATLNPLVEGDVNKGLYEEYILDEVKPEEIKNIYIPKVFKNRSTNLDHIEDENLKVYCEKYAYYIDTLEDYLSRETLEKVTFVEISIYIGRYEKTDDGNYVLVYDLANKNETKRFGQISSINSTHSNFQSIKLDNNTLLRASKFIYEI